LRELAKKVNLKRDIDAGTVPIKRDEYFLSAYVIDLPLDSVPDHMWQDILDREWKSSLHLWDRKLFVIGDQLRLVTTIDDIEAKVDWVKKVIQQTNKGVDDYNKETEAAQALTEEESHKRVDEERMNIDTIRETLRRRLG
jgi:tRNA uridine 5-carbamoylmethylation protein Kti12